MKPSICSQMSYIAHDPILASEINIGHHVGPVLLFPNLNGDLIKVLL